MEEYKLTYKESKMAFVWVLSLMSICLFDIDTIMFWISFAAFVGISLYGIISENKDKSLNKAKGGDNDDR